ncbi:MAG: hypothetical protein IB618_03445 [Candidatus Pacearchaeota archaeon]|nr:MAG: hypothetical protein IB618_03445 [Candidatus Pacearchaeota archaeon]
MLKDKRGVELGWEFIFTLIFIIAIIIILTLWVSNQASGIAMKKQVLAKETCLLISTAEPGTRIIIEHDTRVSIEKEGNGVVVKEGEFDRGYFYDCYLKDNVDFSRKDAFTIINIR